MVEDGSRLIFLDAGTGMSRLSKAALREVVASADEVVVLLSHFHLDHTIGLTYAPLFFEGKTVRILGPGPEISGHRTKDVLDRMLSSPTFPRSPDRFPMKLTIADLGPGINDVAGGLEVEARAQRHSDPSAGLRVVGVSYITDTACDEGTIEFAGGSRVLLHDAYFDHLDYREIVERDEVPSMEHAHATGVAELARETGVAETYLIHLNPRYGETRLKDMLDEARTRFGAVNLPNDLDVLALGG
jgi:ribonuclease BN (tRNA processing enzyme)